MGSHLRLTGKAKCMNTYVNPVGIVKKDIYIIKNDINTKVYIGQSKNTEVRFKNHCCNNNDNSLITAAIKKYGKEHFWFEILENQISNYNEREKYWIRYYNSKVPFGYNILSGGETPPIYRGDDSPKTKISNSEVLNLNGKLTEEDVDNIINLLKYTYRLNGSIAREYGVEVHLISKINNGVLHHRDNIQYPIRSWKSSGKELLTYEEVTEIIKLLLKSDNSINSIAKKYNVTKTVIQGINRGTTKKYLREELSYPIRKF